MHIRVLYLSIHSFCYIYYCTVYLPSVLGLLLIKFSIIVFSHLSTLDALHGVMFASSAFNVVKILHYAGHYLLMLHLEES